MLNRNSSQSSLSRNSSMHKQNQSSFSIEKNKNCINFSQESNQNFMKNYSSPINKVEMEFSRVALHEDNGNYSSNYVNQEQRMSKNPSRGQSPANKQNNKPQFFASKKYSIPQNLMLNNMGCKSQWTTNPPRQISHEFSTLQKKGNPHKVSFLKLPQSQQQQTEYSQKMSDNNRQQQYFSQKSIQSNNNLHEKYSNLSRNYQQLQREYERIKQENVKLRVHKEQLMNENVKTRKQASQQIGNMCQEIQSLKQQIYRMQMDRQSQIMSNKSLSISSISQNNNRGCYTRELSFYKARSNNPIGNVTQNGEINLFYIQQLQRQNDQLVRENRRLNDMIMKKLKHSVAE